MSTAVSEATLPAAALDGVLVPRDGLLLERAIGNGRFEQAEGPMREYRRSVTVEHLQDGRVRVRQTVRFRLSVPFFAFLFELPAKRRLGRIGPATGPQPWWAPPQRLDRRGATVLGTLAGIAVVTGYLNSLLSQTVTFAADEFGANNRSQGIAGFAVRAAAVLAVLVVARADRKGRRRVTLTAAVLGCVVSALGAAAPSLAWLTASQMAGRAFATALIPLIAILAAEEMPSGSRAYAVSLLALAGGLGAGMVVLALRMADIGVSGWRLIYLVALLGLPIVARAARTLPESRRFTAAHGEASLADHGQRFWLLAISLFLVNLFVAPASFFGNRYLRNERGFSAGDISLFTICTATPAAIGVMFGGRWADVHGRRRVGAFATAVGYGLSATVFFASGWPLWAVSVAAGVIGQAATPALGVYGPELFPTGLRGRANGLIGVAGLTGSGIGLLLAGFASDAQGRFGPVMAFLALGPLALAVLVLVAYPETAHRELEDLNPEDRPAAAP